MDHNISAWQGPKVRCPQCGSPIENRIDQLIGSCADLRCRGPFLAKKSRDQEAKRRADDLLVLQNAVDLLESILDSSSHLKVKQCNQDGRLHKVPNCTAIPATLPEQRIVKFKEHLRTILEQAQTILSQPQVINSIQVEFSHRSGQTECSPILPVLNGCATCRGYCCRNGADEAFLTPQLLVWQLLNDLTVTLESLESYYLNQLPEVSMEDSCVFHTDRGCALARERRSSICNEFHCWELQAAIERYSPVEESEWIAIANRDNSIRIGIMEANATRREIALDSSSLLCEQSPESS